MKCIQVLAFVAAWAAIASGCGSSDSSSSNANNVTMSPANGSTLADATIGVVYTQTFTVVAGGTAPYTLIPAGTPGGLTFTTISSFSGALSGTPTQTGQGAFQLQVIDANNQITQLSYVLSVLDASGGTLTISPASLAAPILGSAYSATLSVSSGTSPFTWSVSSGSLPPGLTLGASTTNMVTLSGTPTQTGSFTFTVRVTDSSSSGSQSGFVTYTLTVS